jgi:hypothetical protein
VRRDVVLHDGAQDVESTFVGHRSPPALPASPRVPRSARQRAFGRSATSRKRLAALDNLAACLLALDGGNCQSNEVAHDRFPRGAPTWSPRAVPPGSDVLAGDWRRPANGRSVEQPAEIGLVVEDVTTGWCGEIVRIEPDLGTVDLEDRHGVRKTFRLGPGFWLDGKPVALTALPKAGPAGPTRTASGSRAVGDARAKVALPSRIWVEGRHDAELVEKVWGDDLRVEGVAVEHLGGIDDLGAAVTQFAPGPGRKLGVLVDHLVSGSKESRIAAQFAGNPHVLVVGHPFVDVWQSVKPERLGVQAWPVIPRGIDWKHGICEAFGWPHADHTDIAHAWRRILGTVRSYADLEPELLGRVEELIDFVTSD